MSQSDHPQRNRPFGFVGSTLAALALLAVLAGACAPLREFFVPAPPTVPEEWAALVDEIRAYTRRIGFSATPNFLTFSEETQSFPFCGHAPRLTLPYSYEDPAIRWSDAETDEECRKIGAGTDTYFGTVEALGEIGTPMTLSMVESKLDRFLYVVIHEDCHDQFALPYGIEEALCNLIAYKAMAEFTDEKFGSAAREDRAVRRYAAQESRRTRATKNYYEQLASLYARHDRKELTADALLEQRARILASAQRTLNWTSGELNNVVLASHMTYSRHYAFLEGVFDALGRDLARTVAFFREVDRMKPTPEAVMKRRGIATQESVEFIREYEAAVIETIRGALPDALKRR